MLLFFEQPSARTIAFRACLIQFWVAVSARLGIGTHPLAASATTNSWKYPQAYVNVSSPVVVVVVVVH